jgi:hypothetical protein
LILAKKFDAIGDISSGHDGHLILVSGQSDHLPALADVHIDNQRVVTAC